VNDVEAAFDLQQITVTPLNDRWEARSSCDAGVILCGGTITLPQLLMRLRIGPARNALRESIRFSALLIALN